MITRGVQRFFHSLKPTPTHPKQRRPLSYPRSTEVLEARVMLSATAPDVSAIADQSTSEGTELVIEDLATFTDLAESGISSSVGLNPADFSSLGTLTVAAGSTAVIDTDTLTLTINGTDEFTGVLDSGIAVFTFDAITIDAGAMLTATGSNPLALLSQSTIDVAGTIDVSANGSIGGAGGGDGGTEPNFTNDGPPLNLNFDGEAGAEGFNATGTAGAGGIGRAPGDIGDVAGGGGGALAGAGGNSAGINRVAGGTALSAAVLESLLLIGGSGGGASSGLTSLDDPTALRAPGGGGGGALELGALGTVTVSGSILSRGGDGDILLTDSNPSVGNRQIRAVGGGGSGGSVFVHASDVALTGTIDVSGGNSAGFNQFSNVTYGGAGGGGFVLIADATSGDLGGTIITDGGISDSPVGDGNGGVGLVSELEVIVTPPADPEFTFEIDWGDGTVESGLATIDMLGDDVTPTEGSLNGAHTYADNGVFTVTVTITDVDGNTSTDTFDVTVGNEDPTITSFTNSADTFGNASSGDVVSVSFSFEDLGFTNVVDGTVEEFTAVVDWGDGTIETITADMFTVVDGAAGTPTTGSITLDHVYNQGGLFDVTVTLFDDDLGTDDFTTTSFVSGVGIINGELQIIGTNANDFVYLVKCGAHAYLGGNFFANTWIDLSMVTGITALLGDGDDVFLMSSWIGIDATIDVGAGRDTVIAGAGDDLIIGGDGSDYLLGGRGNDTIMGDAGGDWIKGGSGDDILYGGDGNDIIFGGTGDDVLIGGDGWDWLFGGPGADLIVHGEIAEETTVEDLELVQEQWLLDQSA